MTPLIDFSSYVDERTRDFTGREMIFRAIDDWLEDDAAPRILLLRADPGAGKTAIAGRLWQFSTGAQPPPAGTRHLRPDVLTASHFCWTRDRRWYDPRVFARSLSLQLGARLMGFTRAVIETSSDERIRLEIAQRIGSLDDSQAIGVIVEQLLIARMPPTEGFNLIVREPLEVVCASPRLDRVVILVDALDEAQKWTDDPVNIATLLGEAASLPAQVRLILTARTGADVLPDGADVKVLSLTAGDPLAEALQDVHEYALTFCARHPKLRDKLAHGLTVDALAGAIRDRSKGNFLWIKSVLNMLHRGRGPITTKTLDALPSDLVGMYAENLGRLVRGSTAWEERFEPVLTSLAVAQEAVTRDELIGFSGLDLVPLSGVLGSLGELLDAGVPGKGRRYALYHRSFADFLLDTDREKFLCDATARNERIADHYVGLPSTSWDEYGLRHAPWHLTEVLTAADGPKPRGPHIQRLLDVVLDEAFRRAHVAVASDTAALPRALDTALRLAAAELDAPASIAEAALTLVGMQDEGRRPQLVFEAARVGNVAAAERRLEQLDVQDPQWKAAALMTIAWLAASAQPVEAHALFMRAVSDQLAEVLAQPGALPLLRTLVQSELAGTPVVPSGGGMSVSVDLIEAIMARAEGWRDVNGPDLEEQFGLLNQLEETAFASGYEQSLHVTGSDASVLVQFAIDEPLAGKQLLRRYLAALARNQYVAYRNRFLWQFLTSVLQHRAGEWQRDLVTDVVTAALAGGGVQIHDAVSIALLGESLPSLELRRHAAETAAARLQPGRGSGDTTGAHKRGLGALSETLAVRLPTQIGIARELLERALDLPYGYAGYQAPACLTLAESLRVCFPADPVALQRALDGALTAAHNVQEPTFCLRTTARVNALRERWWQGQLIDLEHLVERFVGNPLAAEFTGVHHVGETFAFRQAGAFSIDLPPDVLGASTLWALAEVYRLALDDLRRVNPTVLEDVPLPQGTLVNIPDPELVPLLAARFAAEALGQPAGARVIQRLVPLAITNLTALDTILGRLVLAASPLDAGSRERVEAATRALAPELSVSGRAVGIEIGAVSGGGAAVGVRIGRIGGGAITAAGSSGIVIGKLVTKDFDG